jgi:hypothetical protein
LEELQRQEAAARKGKEEASAQRLRREVKAARDFSRTTVRAEELRKDLAAFNEVPFDITSSASVVQLSLVSLILF